MTPHLASSTTRARRPRRSRALFPFARRTPVLLVPGLRDSGAGHWQTLWQARYPEFVRVVQRDFAAPAIDDWSAAIGDAVAAAGAPPLVVAHSFGCLATIHAARRGARLAGALLVAPADPDRFDVRDALTAQALPFPATLVASTNDPWLKLVKAGALASQWGATLVVERNAGHINVESGHGDWPAGYALLRDLAERAAATRPALN